MNGGVVTMNSKFMIGKTLRMVTKLESGWYDTKFIFE